MSLAPLSRVREVLPLVPRHVVTDFVQRDDLDSCRLDPPVTTAGVVDQLRTLADSRQQFAGAVPDRQRRRSRLFAANTAASSRSPRPSSPS